MLAGIKSVLSDPKLRTWLFAIFTLLLYFTRTRPPDQIHDMQFVADLGFLAAGKTGVIVVNLEERETPVEVTIFDTTGFANALEVIGDRVYVADGPDGVAMLSLKSLINDGVLTHLDQVSTPGDVIDLAIAGNYAFVVDSREDLLTIQIDREHDRFAQVSRHDIPGKAQRIKISGSYAFISNDKNRLFIYDISNPAELRELAAMDIQAQINDFIIVGDRVYLAANTSGLVVLNFSALPELPDVFIEAKYNQIGSAQDVTLRGDYAYVASGRAGFYILDIDDFGRITTVGHKAGLSDARQIEVKDEFVYIGDELDGLKAFESPILFDFKKLAPARSQGLFEDVVVKDNHAYVAAGEAGIKVIDVENAIAPVLVPYNDEVEDYATALDIRGDYIYVTYRTKGLREYFIGGPSKLPEDSGVEAGIPGEANDVVFDGRFAYVAGGSEGFHVIDFSDIANPKRYSVDTPGNAQSIYYFENYAYVADGPQGLQIISIDNRQNPRLVRAIDTPGEAEAVYVSWLPNTAGEQRIYAFVADGSNGLVIFDITDLNNPVNVTTYETEAYVNDVIVQGWTAFLAEREDGLITLDLTVISDPTLMGNQSTPGDARKIYLQDNLAYLADAGRGLRLISIEEQNYPQAIGFFDIPAVVRDLVIQKPYGYMVDGREGLWVLDLSDPKTPVPLSFFRTPGDALKVTVLGSLAYIADGAAGLQVIDISNATSPVFVGSYEEVGNAVAVTIRGSYAYIATGGKGMHILNITDPANIYEESYYETIGITIDIGVSDRYAYIAESDQGIEVVNIEDPTDPFPMLIEGGFDIEDARAILVLEQREHVFVADGVKGLKVYDVQSPINPRLVYYYPLSGGIATDIVAQGDYVFFVADQGGVFPFYVLDLNNITLVDRQRLQQTDTDQLDSDEAFRARSVAVISNPVPNARVKRLFTYVTADEQGLQIFRTDGEADIKLHHMYETPGEATFRQIVRSIPRIFEAALRAQPDLVQQKVWDRLQYIFFGWFVFLGLSGLYLVLFSQFVLPVQTLQDGAKAVRLFWASLSGEHGPVVFVKGGDIVQREGELERRGPGVARVDLNSAIVLEKRAFLPQAVRRQLKGRKFSRARTEGPGIVFISPYERIHGVADLRPQFRLRPGIQAYTRDGIEISNPVWVLFTLGQPPEVLDVTYEGERRAENLRVIHLADNDIPTQDDLKQLSDEDAHYYKCYQAVRRFFQKSRELISTQKDDPVSIQEQLFTLTQFADEWDILDDPQVAEFISEFRKRLPDLDTSDHHEIELFVNNINQLADTLLGQAMTDFYDNTYRGKKQRGLIIKQLTDELDPDDRQEIHRYVQKQTITRYFANVKLLADKLGHSQLHPGAVQAYVSKVNQLAIRWGIQHRQDVQQFIGAVSALILEISLTDQLEVRWLAYHASMLADELSSADVIAYYRYLYQEEISQYQVGLRDLVSTRGLSRFARRAMLDLSNFPPQDDSMRLFSLNALNLWQSVRPEFEAHLTKLEGDPANQVQVDLLRSALQKFDRITTNLVRTEYPFQAAYGAIANLRADFSRLQQVAQGIHLRDEWNLPEFLRLWQIRRLVGKIKQHVSDLDTICDPVFKRYIDLIKFYDHIQFLQSCVDDFQQVEADGQLSRPGLQQCVRKIKRHIPALTEISHSSFQRPIRRLTRWAEALNAKDPVYVHFFAQQIQDLWERIETGNTIAIKRHLRNIKTRTDQLRRDIRQFKAQQKALESNGEILQYRRSIDQLEVLLKDLRIPAELLKSDVDDDKYIKVGPFQFTRKRVLAAVYSKALDIDQEGKYMPWTDLPAHAAVRTFRDLVSKEQYDYLFEPKDPHKFNIPKLKGNFSRAMRNQGVLAFRFIDHIDGQGLSPGSSWLKDDLIFYESRELQNPKVLRARGIKVIAAGFPDLFPVSPQIPQQWLETWRAPWESKAIDVRGQHHLQAVRVINQARARAQRDMAHTLARILQSSRSEEALAMRVFQALEAMAVDKDTRQFLPRDTMYLLRSFKQWFLPAGEGQVDTNDQLDSGDDGRFLDMKD